MGGANGDVALSAVSSGGCCAEVLSGLEGAVRRLVEVELVVAVVDCSMGGAGGS